MKKKICVALLVFFLLCSWIAQVVYVNKNTEKPIREDYEMNEWVSFGNNYFYRSDRENRNGYEITVTNAELVSYDDFIKSRNLKVVKNELSFIPEKILNVTVIIKNTNNTSSGISMLDTTLNSSVDRLSIDYEIFDALYPQLQGSISFSVKPGTQMEFQFPFAVTNASFQMVYTDKYFHKTDFFLNITQYPVEKNIKITL